MISQVARFAGFSGVRVSRHKIGDRVMDSNNPCDTIPHMRTLIVSLYLLAFAGAPLEAEMTVEQYKTRMKTPVDAAATKVYIKGLGEGIGWANVEARARRMPLYCPPDKLGLDVANYIDILDHEIERFTKTSSPAEANGTWIGLLRVN